jgi:phosphatidylglycerol:prolipoprotein diacylglycerol transferase
MFPYLRLGPFLLQLPPLALLIGVWIGSFLVEKEAVRLKMAAGTINNLIFLGLTAGVIGARLAYAAHYLNVYLANPLSLFALNWNTLSVTEGLFIGFTVAAFYSWRKKLPLRPTLDALALGLAAFMLFLGMAHFLSGDAFGKPANLPWSIYLWNDYRHPSQIYEILAALVILFTTYKRPLGQGGNGVNFLLFISLSAAARVFLEAFRGDSLIWTGGFRATQVIGLLILACALYMMGRWGQSKKSETEEENIDR